jgi:hypothetical protein
MGGSGDGCLPHSPDQPVLPVTAGNTAIRGVRRRRTIEASSSVRDEFWLPRLPRRLLDTGSDALVQRVQDALGPLDGDAVILVPLIAGDERLAHAQALGQLALGEAVRDAQRDQQPADLRQPRDRREFAPPHSLRPLRFLGDKKTSRNLAVARYTLVMENRCLQ